MGTTTGQQIVDKAAIELQDITNTRWSSSELLVWLNEGMLELARLKPTAVAKTSSVLLDAGKTDQDLPADGFTLINVIRNMGADGATAGNVVRLTTKESLDSTIPDWHFATNTAGSISHFANDHGDPKSYYVYPKAPDSSWYLEIIYGKIPTTMTLVSTIEVFDIYATALTNYVVYRALSKEDEAGAAQKAAAFYQLFTTALGA